MAVLAQVTILFLFAALIPVQAYTIPSNLQKIYDNHKPGKCTNSLQGGFIPEVSSSDSSFCYCGDINGAIYIHSSRNGGQYADMDIDCDGANNKQGKCDNDPSGQSITAFQDIVQGYNVGISDLDANVHPYVVLGNSGSTPSFDPQKYGIKPLSVVALVCNKQLHYGIWGDTNGEYEDIPGTTVGEASIALGDLCFPNENLSGDNGHSGFDVMYIAFKGSAAVPGKNGATWNTQSTKTFENSIKALGDKLVAGLQ